MVSDCGYMPNKFIDDRFLFFHNYSIPISHFLSGGWQALLWYRQTVFRYVRLIHGFYGTRSNCRRCDVRQENSNLNCEYTIFLRGSISWTRIAMIPALLAHSGKTKMGSKGVDTAIGFALFLQQSEIVTRIFTAKLLLQLQIFYRNIIYNIVSVRKVHKLCLFPWQQGVGIEMSTWSSVLSMRFTPPWSAS